MSVLEKIKLEKGVVYKPSRTGTAKILKNIRISAPDSPDEVRHLLLDMSQTGMKFYEGQSVGVIPPGTMPNGRAYKVRLYSVASSREGEDGKGNILAFCIKKDSGEKNEEKWQGICSSYLCNLDEGAEIVITGPVGRTFLLPQEKTVNLLMFATGTGIAPYRGFAQYIQKKGWDAECLLFMGCKTQKEALYFNQQNSELKNCSFFNSYLALSRVESTKEGHKMYVQYKLKEYLAEVWKMIMEGNFSLYICGLKGLEKGIEEILAQKAEAESKNWGEMKLNFRKEGRWNIEVY